MPDHIQLLLLLLFAGFYLLAALHLIDYLRIMWKEMRKNERIQRGRPAGGKLYEMHAAGQAGNPWEPDLPEKSKTRRTQT